MTAMVRDGRSAVPERRASCRARPPMRGAYGRTMATHPAQMPVTADPLPGPRRYPRCGRSWSAQSRSAGAPRSCSGPHRSRPGRTSSRRLPTASRSAAQAASICRACVAVQSLPAGTGILPGPRGQALARPRRPASPQHQDAPSRPGPTRDDPRFVPSQRHYGFRSSTVAGTSRPGRGPGRRIIPAPSVPSARLRAIGAATAGAARQGAPRKRQVMSPAALRTGNTRPGQRSQGRMA